MSTDDSQSSLANHIAYMDLATTVSPTKDQAPKRAHIECYVPRQAKNADRPSSDNQNAMTSAGLGKLASNVISEGSVYASDRGLVDSETTVQAAYCLQSQRLPEVKKERPSTPLPTSSVESLGGNDFIPPPPLPKATDRGATPLAAKSDPDPPRSPPKALKRKSDYGDLKLSIPKRKNTSSTNGELQSSTSQYVPTTTVPEGSTHRPKSLASTFEVPRLSSSEASVSSRMPTLRTPSPSMSTGSSHHVPKSGMRKFFETEYGVPLSFHILCDGPVGEMSEALIKLGRGEIVDASEATYLVVFSEPGPRTADTPELENAYRQTSGRKSRLAVCHRWISECAMGGALLDHRPYIVELQQAESVFPTQREDEDRVNPTSGSNNHRDTNYHFEGLEPGEESFMPLHQRVRGLENHRRIDGGSEVYQE